MLRIFLFSFLAAVGFSSLVHAQTVDAKLTAYRQAFPIDSRLDMGGNIYYRCDSLEGQVTEMLKEMGATQIRVHCSGGIQDGIPDIGWDASVSMAYSTAREAHGSVRPDTRAEWTSVRMHTSEGCPLLKQVFTQVQRNFEIKDLNGPSCAFNNGAFNAEFSVLQPVH